MKSKPQVESKYKVLHFEKDLFPSASGKRKFVAVIEHADYPESPFRVAIENAGSAEQANKDVADWIACREQEDANALAEADRAVESEEEDSILSELNA